MWTDRLVPRGELLELVQVEVGVHVLRLNELVEVLLVALQVVLHSNLTINCCAGSSASSSTNFEQYTRELAGGTLKADCNRCGPPIPHARLPSSSKKS